MARVLAVGTEESVADLVEPHPPRPAPRLARRRRVHARPAPARTAADVVGVPVVGDLDAVAALALAGRYDAVSVGPTPGWTPRRLHQLAWDLEGSGIELVVDPGLMEIAGPRLHMRTSTGCRCCASPTRPSPASPSCSRTRSTGSPRCCSSC